MKIVTLARNSKLYVHFDTNTNGDVEKMRVEESEEDRKLIVFHAGARVERELDGLWFPGTVTDAEPKSDRYEIEYDEELNRESEVSASELRLFDPSQTQKRFVTKEFTAQQRAIRLKDSLLMQTPEYAPNKAPTVVLHRRGEIYAATGYIINGLENNVATGNGLRGIRWLRGNSF